MKKTRFFFGKILIYIAVILLIFYLKSGISGNVNNLSDFSSEVKLQNYNRYVRKEIYERYLWTQINLDSFIYKTNGIFMDYYSGQRLVRRSFSAQIDPEDFSIPAWIRIHLYYDELGNLCYAEVGDFYCHGFNLYIHRDKIFYISYGGIYGDFEGVKIIAENNEEYEMIFRAECEFMLRMIDICLQNAYR